MTSSDPKPLPQPLRFDPAPPLADASIRPAEGLTRESYGALGPIAQWVAATRGGDLATPSRAQLILVPGRHGIATAHPAGSAEAVTTLPESYADDLIAAVRDGVAPVCDAAERAGMSLSVLDTGTVSGVLGQEAALSPEAFAAAAEAGIAEVDACVDSGMDILAIADGGAGVTAMSAAVLGSLCTIEPVLAVGFGSGIGDDGWRRKVAAVRDAMFRVRNDRGDVQRVLRASGGADLVAMTAMIAHAAQRRTPVIVDGIGALTAGLCATILSPGADAWWRPAAALSEPAAATALASCQAEPLLPVVLPSGHGMATCAVMPLVHAALTLAR